MASNKKPAPEKPERRNVHQRTGLPPYENLPPPYRKPKDGKHFITSDFEDAVHVESQQDYSRTLEKWRLTHIYELIDSEEAFVKTLRTAEEDVLRPLRDRKNPHKDIHAIYSNWEEIFKSSTSLLSSLQTSEQETRVEPHKWRVGQVLVNKLPKVKAWLAYSSLQKDLLSLLSEQSTTKPSKSPNKESSTFEQSLTKYLLQPQERVQVYPDLIQKILKNTPINHPDYKDLQDAHTKAQQNCDHVSVSLEVMKDVEVLKHIEDIVTFPNPDDKFNFISGTRCMGPRRLIHTGVLKQIKDGKEFRCVVFLTNDSLLVVQPTKYTPNLTPECYMDRKTKINFQACKPVMFLNMLEVLKRVAEDPTVFYLMYTDPDKYELSILNLKSSNPSERKLWTTKIEETSKQYVEARRELYQSQNKREVKVSSKNYVAKYRFSSDDPQALTFIQGDVIKVPENQEGASAGWVFGSSMGRTGWFPQAYITVQEDANIKQDTDPAADKPPASPGRGASLRRQVPIRIPADGGESVTASTEGVDSRSKYPDKRFTTADFGRPPVAERLNVPPRPLQRGRSLDDLNEVSWL